MYRLCTGFKNPPLSTLERVKRALITEKNLQLVKYLIFNNSSEWNKNEMAEFLSFSAKQADATYAIDFAVDLWTRTKNPVEINEIITKCVAALSADDELSLNSFSCLYMYNNYLIEVSNRLNAKMPVKELAQVVVEMHAKYSTKNITTLPRLNRYENMLAHAKFRQYYKLLDMHIYNTLNKFCPSLIEESNIYFCILFNNWSHYIPDRQHSKPVIDPNGKRVKNDVALFTIGPIMFLERQEFLLSLQGRARQRDECKPYECRCMFLKRGLRLLNNYCMKRFSSTMLDRAESFYKTTKKIEEDCVLRLSQNYGWSLDITYELLYVFSCIIYLRQQIRATKCFQNLTDAVL